MSNTQEVLDFQRALDEFYEMLFEKKEKGEITTEQMKGFFPKKEVPDDPFSEELKRRLETVLP